MRSIQDLINTTTQIYSDQVIKSQALKKKKKSKVVAPKNEVVFQHNNLIEANYKLSLQEKRIILWLTSQIQPTDEDLKKHRIRAVDLCELIESELNYQH